MAQFGRRIKQLFISVAINTIPVLAIYLVLLPIWIIAGSDNIFSGLADTIAPMLTLLISLFFLPVLLMLLNDHFNKIHARHGFITNIILMIISACFWNLLDYVCWSVSVGRQFFIRDPDPETVLINRCVFDFNIIFILILGLSIHFVVLKRGKTLASAYGVDLVELILKKTQKTKSNRRGKNL